MAAHSGKGSANGSGANPALDADAAEELAANFRPSWAADDDDDLPPGLAKTQPNAEAAQLPAAAPAAAPAVSIAPVVTISSDAPAPSPAAAVAAAAAATAAAAPAPPHTQKMLSPQTVLGMGSPVRSPEPSSEALDSQNVIEVAPAANSLSTTQPMGNNARVANSSPPVASASPSAPPRSAAPASAKPVTRNVTRPAAAVDPFKASALDSDEFPPIRKSNKGVIFGVVGVAIAVGLGLFLKFALSPDEPAKPATTTPAATAAPAKENDIPPPPAKEDIPPAATTATPPPAVAKTDPAPAVTTADPPKKADPPPVAKAPDPPRTVAAAPAAKPPKQPAAASPPPAAPPKTPPKSTGGGIVRDSPF
jgi:hypothetical protein